MPENNILKDNAKIIVMAGLAGPALFIFFELQKSDWSIWIPLGVAALGLWIFNDSFIEKALVRTAKENMPGPSQPFIPPNAEQWRYEFDDHGDPVPRRSIQPPSNWNRQPPQYGR